MDKKHSIVISVVVNAALLLVLFIAAVKKHDNVMTMPSSPQMVQTEKEAKEMEQLHPLFSGLPQSEKKKDTQEQSFDTLASVDEIIIPQKEQIKPEKVQAEAQVVYKLPSLATTESTSSQPKIIQAKKEMFQEVLVQKGDSLEKIAKRYGIKIAEIKEINKIEGHLLQIGQGLLLPKDAQKKQPTTPAKPQEAGEYYTVKRGDNPWTIAMKHHLRVDELLKLNHLDQEKAKKLRPGDKLRIR